MVQKIHPRGVIWVQSKQASSWSLVRKENDNLAVQYKDVHDLMDKVTKGLFHSNSKTNHLNLEKKVKLLLGV